MGELWDELADARKEKQLLAEAVAEIKGLCSKEHNKNHFGECPECWPRLINRVRDRYLNPSTKAWFSGRRLFLQELDTLFTQALEQDPINLAQIEKRIEDEKKEWYRDKLKNLGLVSAARTPAEAQALQQILDDRNIPVPQVATNLRGALGDIANESGEAFDMFMDRLKGAKSQEEKTEVYVDMFFQPQRDPEGAAKSQKYIEMLRGGRSLSDVISAVLRDRQTNNGVQDQKDSLREKISELERAKAAHEAGKAKKAKIKQDKANAAAAARPLLNLPPCAVCGNAIDEQNFQPCFTCITLSEVYHVLGHPPAVFCSNECIERGFESHDLEAHECASGEGCIRLQDDEDEIMDQENPAIGFCKECVLDHQVESAFCSIQCLDANFQRHREEVHIPKRDRAGQIGEDEDDLEHAPDDKSKYRARKIGEHWTPLNDAVKEYIAKGDVKRAEA